MKLLLVLYPRVIFRQLNLYHIYYFAVRFLRLHLVFYYIGFTAEFDYIVF